MTLERSRGCEKFASASSIPKSPNMAAAIALQRSTSSPVLEFGSADSALRCAIEVQRLMSADNQSKAADERIEFRIGINLGDIIVDGNDIAGDGVNVAARLEALAEPGGICVSAGVREQVHGQLDVEFVDGGEQRVKNIARPIRVFWVGFAKHSPPRRKRAA